ncbi:putative nucleoside 2-deoxyribosyltransferase [Tepidicaulis marinus]|uniref:Putative nucleoside 2-deoxyribosyltransferase n=1 Tax=Tepidicaulis marinus TaxID=1333998 RepID=A0A081BD55_9HYPH|nr:nucleoside 2-deoxyribosyltransferase [Tepidicaulis marinus]GAK45973.1 putative nucleoside 2-deoxyribosyltransferase [Tepidicaulis marinus]
MEHKKIYLAGPEVFLEDAVQLAERKKAICAAHGLRGLFPLDAGLDLSGLAPQAAGLAIYEANIALIEAADACIANVTPFRGPSLDPGTAYEIGHMRGLGKPVFAYSNAPEHFAERTRLYCAASGERDAEGLLIEDFGLTDNLMIDGAVMRAGPGIEIDKSGQGWHGLKAFEICVRRAAEFLATV